MRELSAVSSATVTSLPYARRRADVRIRIATGDRGTGIGAAALGGLARPFRSVRGLFARGSSPDGGVQYGPRFRRALGPLAADPPRSDRPCRAVGNAGFHCRDAGRTAHLCHARYRRFGEARCDRERAWQDHHQRSSQARARSLRVLRPVAPALRPSLAGRVSAARGVTSRKQWRGDEEGEDLRRAGWFAPHHWRRPAPGPRENKARPTMMMAPSFFRVDEWRRNYQQLVRRIYRQS